MDMADKPFFDKTKSDYAIERICDVMDDMEMTLFERWWASHCIEAASRAMMGETFEELARKYGDELGIGTEKQVEVEPVAVEEAD